MKKNLQIPVLAISIVIMILASCQREAKDSRNARVQVYLTDNPGDYEAVFIDVVDIKVNISGDTINGWQSLTGVNAGVYDLLTLVNDNDTLLADAAINSGRLHQMRLVLGTENFVKVNGQLIRLKTPSAQQSGLKLNIQQDVLSGVLYKIVLDFDVAKSIVKTGNDKYILKPVIRTMLEAAGGSIKGVVLPNSFQTAVLAIQGPDTVASTYTASNGSYLIKGLTAGTYSVSFLPVDSLYRDSLRTGINVTTGQVTLVDTTVLQQ